MRIQISSLMGNFSLKGDIWVGKERSFTALFWRLGFTWSGGKHVHVTAACSANTKTSRQGMELFTVEGIHLSFECHISGSGIHTSRLSTEECLQLAEKVLISTVLVNVSVLYL